ncbi:MAG TPA: YqgE/AlgH family protein [Candidatus Acidoferrum sp.]|nr:YqgE/AlgH family protein [Candidatus Acidoferrum sp.]
MGIFARALLGAAVATALITAPPPRSSTAADRGNLTGRLLVATPKLEDPTFAKSVIFLVAHDDSGSLGLIVNEPVKDISFGELFDLMQQSHADLDGKVTVHFGGPVEPRVGFVLHSKDFMLDEHELPAGDMAVTTDADMLAAIAEKHGPAHYLVTLGYAGWGPGQLEMEMQQGDWLIVPSDPDLVFAPDPQSVWQRALAKYQTQL